MAQTHADDDGGHSVRLDKWLWAARFYKTRGIAVEAIAGGKVLYNGERPKPAHLVRVGDEVRIRLGPYEHVVQVRELALRRGPAKQAQLMYEETAASIAAREKLAAQLKAASAFNPQKAWTENKKERRDVRRMRGRD
ncbi:MAG: RNA-binding S4 domain-containing protein [Gemmatimonadaceae bacterium]|nr:RNA-binding S4 domain-containing protein [Gemmatimonadaceae bacterium]